MILFLFVVLCFSLCFFGVWRGWLDGRWEHTDDTPTSNLKPDCVKLTEEFYENIIEIFQNVRDNVSEGFYLIKLLVFLWLPFELLGRTIFFLCSLLGRFLYYWI